MQNLNNLQQQKVLCHCFWASWYHENTHSNFTFDMNQCSTTYKDILLEITYNATNKSCFHVLIFRVEVTVSDKQSSLLRTRTMISFNLNQALICLQFLITFYMYICVSITLMLVSLIVLNCKCACI